MLHDTRHWKHGPVIIHSKPIPIRRSLLISICVSQRLCTFYEATPHTNQPSWQAFCCPCPEGIEYHQLPVSLETKLLCLVILTRQFGQNMEQRKICTCTSIYSQTFRDYLWFSGFITTQVTGVWPRSLYIDVLQLKCEACSSGKLISLFTGTIWTSSYEGTVSIATSYGLDGQLVGVRVPVRTRFFIISVSSRMVLKPIQSLMQ
jgi:hypothetical protein